MAGDLAERVRQQMARAFRDRLEAALAAGEEAEWLGALYAEMRDGLCALVPRRTDLHARFHEALDVGFLQQRLRHGAFDADAVRGIVTSAYGALAQLQAPDRDGATAEQRARILRAVEERGLAPAVAEFVVLFNEELQVTQRAAQRAREELLRAAGP